MNHKVNIAAAPRTAPPLPSLLEGKAAVNVRTAAAVLDCSVNHVWNLAKRGRIRLVRIDGCTRVPVLSIVALVNGDVDVA